MRRISVVSSGSGAGKTTLGRALAAKLGVPYVELDALFWRPNWTQAPQDDFRATVSLAAADHSWVIDGNNSRNVHPFQSSRDADRWLESVSA